MSRPVQVACFPSPKVTATSTPEGLLQLYCRFLFCTLNYAIVARLCGGLSAFARIQHERDPGILGSSQLLHPSWKRNS